MTGLAAAYRCPAIGCGKGPRAHLYCRRWDCQGTMSYLTAMPASPTDDRAGGAAAAPMSSERDHAIAIAQTVLQTMPTIAHDSALDSHYSLAFSDAVILARQLLRELGLS